jgi:hypothetical protein
MDHLIGFAGKFNSTSHFYPQDSNYIVYAIGGLVVIENVNDKHD